MASNPAKLCWIEIKDHKTGFNECRLIIITNTEYFMDCLMENGITPQYSTIYIECFFIFLLSCNCSSKKQIFTHP